MSDVNVGLAVFALSALIAIQLLKKAGYSRRLNWFALIPGFAPFMIVYLSLASWPVEKKLRFFDLRRGVPVKKVAPPIAWNIPAKELRKGEVFAVRQVTLGW